MFKHLQTILFLGFIIFAYYRLSKTSNVSHAQFDILLVTCIITIVIASIFAAQKNYFKLANFGGTLFFVSCCLYAFIPLYYQGKYDIADIFFVSCLLGFLIIQVINRLFENPKNFYESVGLILTFLVAIYELLKNDKDFKTYPLVIYFQETPKNISLIIATFIAASYILYTKFLEKLEQQNERNKQQHQ